MRTLLAGAPDASRGLSRLVRVLAFALLLAGVPAGSARAQVTAAGPSLFPDYPDFHRILITELQTNNRGTLYDGASETGSWLELFNPGQDAVSLDDFALTDEYSRLAKWRFPAGWVIGPQGYLVVWMDGQPSQTTANELHSGIRLKPAGGSIALSRLLKGHALVVDYFDYPSMGPDMSLDVEHLATGGVQFEVLIRPSPGSANSVLPTVVINEWFVNPGNFPGWLELYNPGSRTVDLGGMVLFFFASDIQLAPFSIPQGRKIPAHGFLRVWADAKPSLNDTDSTSLHATFTFVSRPFSLSLLTPAGLTISQVTSKATDPFHPEARFPDGANFYETVMRATPAAPNVGRPRFLTFPPQSQSVRIGNALNLEAKAVGTSPIGYQWYRNEQLIPGATSPTFSIPSMASSDQGSYMLLASNVAGTAFVSSFVTAGILPSIAIDAPIDLSIPIGKGFTLPAAIGGSGQPQVQWKRNGMNIPQETLSTLQRTAAGVDDGGLYTLVAVNEEGAVVSTSVRVLIDASVAKAVDSFADGLDLGASAQGVLRSSNRNATKEPGEPRHAGDPGGHSVWFKWTPTKPGILTLNTRGSTFDTLLAVYTGSSVGALRRVESDDDRGGYYTSELKFNVTTKTVFSIAVDGFGGDTGDFLLSWSFQSTELQLPVILAQPQSVTAVPGSAVTFAVKASANTTGFQWLFNGRAIRGANESTFTIPKVGNPQVGVFSVVLTSADGLTAVSDEARLELGDLPRDPTADKYSPPNTVFTQPKLAGFGPELAGIPTVSVSAGTIGSQVFSVAGSGTQFSEPPPCGRVGGFSRFETFVLNQEADMIIDTVGSGFNTTLSVYALGSTPPLKFQYIGCDKNGSSSTVHFTGKAGTTYYAFVDSADGSTGQTVLNWRCGSLPQLITPAPPITNTVSAGASFSLPTTYSATPPVSSIQWLLNGELAPGNAPMFTVPDAGAEHAGNYSIILSNAMGSVTGSVASITVDVPFELSTSFSPPDSRKSVLIQGLAEQGFLVEASEDMAKWCAFALNPVPLTPFTYEVSNPSGHPRLFFRCHPWPLDPSYTATPCAPGFP